MTIKGTGFLSGATVKIGNPATSVNVVSETEITATTAATAAGSDEVVVTDTKGTSTGGPSYTYVTYGVMAWGDNAHGQLGNGSTTDSHVPVAVSGLGGGVTTVSAGGEHSLARLSDATVKAWGHNQSGQLGNGNFNDSPVPVAVIGLGGKTVTEVAAGKEHSLALLSNGTVMAWGGNAHGQLGNGSTTNSPVPVAVIGLGGKTVTEVAAGKEHSLALLSNGTVMAWGGNAHGQLGNGSTTDSPVPVAVSGLGGKTVTAVSAGGEHSLALLSNGTVMAWGDNAHGQLGNNSTTDNHVPVAVSGLGAVTAVSAGGEHSLALLSNATVMAWGDNAHGQLGNGNFNDSHVPVEVSGLSGKTVTEVAAGGEHSLALLSTGKVMAWGDNAHGQLGNGSTNNSPVPMVASGLGGVTAVSAGGEHSLAYAPPPPTVTSISPSAGTTAGGTSVTIKGTGFLSGATVEIGNPATSVNVVSETEITATTAATAAGSDEVVVTDAGGISTGTPSPSYTYVIPPTVTSISPSAGTTAGGRLVTIKGTGFLSGATVKIGNPATSVNVVSETEITAMTAATAAGSDEVVVTDTKGTSTGGPSYTYVTYGVTAWGDNAHGQLGNNSTTDNHVPVVVSGLGGVTTVSAGGEHSLARLSDATVKAWGDNQFGQLGNNSTTDSHVPVVVNVSGVTEVSAGGEHSLARLSNGTVMAWGDNAHGQLGNGSTNNSPVPVVVSGLGGKTVTEVSAGGEHSLARLSNGTVVAWGDNAHGQLGNNSTNNSAVPVAVSGLGGVTAVAAGGEHSLALLSNGTVVAWGDNAHGQLGNGSTTDNHVPVVVSGMGGVTAVAAGGEHSLALLSNATVMAWGDNAHGQLGNNSTTDNHVQVEVSGLGGKTVTEVAAGGEHSLALLSNATVMAWGDNAHGQLGNGSTTDNHVPVAVSDWAGSRPSQPAANTAWPTHRRPRRSRPSARARAPPPAAPR